MNNEHEQRILRWDGAANGDAFGPARSLVSLAGEGVTIVVAAEQAALVIDHDAVHGVLLEGNHATLVLRDGEESGDVSDKELADRLRVDRADVADVRRRLRIVQHHWQIVHLSLSPLPAVELSNGRPVTFEDQAHGPVEVDIDGACRLVVTDPVKFFEAFLRNTDDLSCHQFERIAAALVQGGIERALDESYRDLDSIERDHRVLGNRLASQLDPSLAHVGLAIDQIDVTRLQTPTGLVRAEASQDVPSLASPARRQ